MLQDLKIMIHHILEDIEHRVCDELAHLLRPVSVAAA